VETGELELKAMVPVSVRSEDARGTLGNQVAAMMAPLPIGCEDPLECYALIGSHMRQIKDSGQAVGAQVLTNLAGFAPPTIMSQAARLFARQRFFNLVVTNVPGPQFPLYLLGRRLLSCYPQVPLAAQQTVGIALLSYAGNVGVGLLADLDVRDLAALAGALRGALDELTVIAEANPRESARPVSEPPPPAEMAPGPDQDPARTTVP
jgi:hypothetical protein